MSTGVRRWCQDLVRLSCLAIAAVLSFVSSAGAAEQQARITRDAFMLGFSYANGHNTYGLHPKPDASSRAAYEGWAADTAEYARALGISVDPTPPTPAAGSSSSHVGVLVSGAHLARLLSIQVGGRHGSAAAAALELGYSTALAPEYVPFLTPEAQSSTVGEYRALAARATLPLNIVDRYARALTSSTDRQKAVSAMFAFKYDVLQHYEAILTQTASGAQQQLNVWLLGSNLGLATLGQTRGASPDLIDRVFEEARARAGVLNVRVPALPETPSDSAGDTASAIHYLLVRAGQTVGKQLTQLYGPGTAALFELAIKSTLALLLYGPEDDMGQTFADVIERSGREAGLPSSVYASVVATMRAKAPYPDAKREIMALDDRVRAHFASLDRVKP